MHWEELQKAIYSTDPKMLDPRLLPPHLLRSNPDELIEEESAESVEEDGPATEKIKDLDCCLHVGSSLDAES